MKKASKEEKAMWLEDWRQSGKSAWSYAKENGIIPQTFVGWVRKAENISTSFVEIPVKTKLKIEPSQIIVIEKDDVKIHVPLSVWAEGSAVIMEGLKAAV